jgi:hypothetical protein
VSEVVVVLRGERAPSWNGFYAGMHYRKRAVIARDIHMLVLAALEPDAEPFSQPVDIYVTATYRRNPVDSDNIVSKCYVDALKGHLIKDDNNKCVRRVTTEAVSGKEDSVTIRVTEVEL